MMLVGSNAAGSGAASGKSISVLYTTDQVFDTIPLATAWWSSISKQFAAAEPGVKLDLQPVGGSEADLINKSAIDFRSTSTTPCVLQIPTTALGEFAGSGYLSSLNSDVSGSSAGTMWSGMPKAVQEITEVNGTVYGIDQGNNTSAILYNKTMLAKAGIPLPWNPKNWQDIITTAEKVKKANPKVWAVWLDAGTAASETSFVQGSDNLIVGSTNPANLDTKTGKWVVSSPGLKATLEFYKTIAQKGLGAPTSELFSPAAAGGPPDYMQEGKAAIVISSNWYSGDWLPGYSAPWPAAAKDVGIAPIPTENGQAPGIATTLTGEALVISKSCPDKAAAWKFITLANNPANQLSTAIGAGFIPADSSVGASAAFTKSSLFQQQFAEYQKDATDVSSNVNLAVYIQALNVVTGDIMQNPSTSISSALSTINSTVSEQLGPNSVETQK
jgi:multiple sugar transport system substrate-binding protein